VQGSGRARKHGITVMGHTQRQLGGQAPDQAIRFRAGRVRCPRHDMSKPRHEASAFEGQSREHRTKHTTADSTAPPASQCVWRLETQVETHGWWRSDGIGRTSGDVGSEVMDRADGLRLRTAVESDLQQIGALLADRGEEADAEDLRLVVDDPDEGLDAVMVMVDGDRVVSTATLLRETVTIGGVDVPAGQVELVATDRAYERRGLVRALMDEAHRRSVDRGDLLQVMIGIPYFYRQFGYAYAMPIPLGRHVHTVPTANPEITVRAATLDDIPVMKALQAAAQAPADVRMPHSAGCWRWLVQRAGSSQLVAEHDGEPIATARLTPPDEGVVLGEIAGTSSGVRALLSAAARVGNGDVTVLERPVTDLEAALAEVADPPEHPERVREWFYARVPALGPLLERLGPVLVERYRAGGFARRQDVLLSSWRSHVRFSIDEHAMSNVVAGGPEQAPISKGGSGVPPDALAPLLLGPFGAAGLETLYSDVLLGRQRALMEALFPPLTSDVLTFYLAC
jgi:predicted N-acetyltransferase YhbS